VTTFTNVPLRIEIAKTSWAADFATQHEVGHAMNVGFRGNRPGFENKLATVFSQEAGNSKLRSYARTTRTEYFAEAFNNYYCSKDAHAFLKATLPKTYDFLSANLSAPRWETDVSTVVRKDLFASLGGDANLTDVAIGAPSDVASVGICRDSLDSCLASKRSDVRFSAAGTSGDRVLFRGLTGLTIADGQVVTLLGFDTAGALKAARAMRFESR
jgi:hypothetical protein